MTDTRIARLLAGDLAVVGGWLAELLEDLAALVFLLGLLGCGAALLLAPESSR